MAAIRDGRQQFMGMPFGQMVEMVYGPLSQMHDVPLPPLTALAVGVAPGLAYINHSRLIADCPDCGGAEFVWRDGPHVMLCASCLNGGIGHRWRPVVLPADLAEIEAVLAARPLPQNRNWAPGETIGQLRAENLAHSGEAVR